MFKEFIIKGISIIKKYYSLSGIKPAFLFFEFLFLLVPSVLSIISPILSANVISSITVFDFDAAKKYLIYDFSIILISAASYFCYHFVSTKVNKSLILNLQNYVYTNVKANKNIDKITMPVLTDIYACTSFNKNLLYKLCFLIKSVVILCIIIKYNLFIAFAIIAVSTVSFLLLKFTDKQIQNNNLKLSSLQSNSLELFNSIHQNAKEEQNEKASSTLKNKYFDIVSDTIKTTNKVSLFYNINNNFITLLLKTTIFVATLFLISEIKTTALTLSLYLILTPYLTSSAQNLISFFDLFSEFGTIENALSNFENLAVKNPQNENKPLELKSFGLTFFNVCTKPTPENEMYLQPTNFKLNENSFYLFVGSYDSGKEILFNLLNKKETPSSGSIFVDDKTLESISQKDFSKIIASTTDDPYFYNISILENLYLVCSNKSKISKTLSAWGLAPKINKLKNKYDTIINGKLNPCLKFFLGLAKCYLSDAKIICVNSIPHDMSAEDNSLLEKIISEIKKDRLLVVFSSNETLSHLANNVFYVKNGKIELNKNSK